MARVTVDLDQDVFEAVREIARDRDLTLGEAVSWLARKGNTARHTMRMMIPLPGAKQPALSVVIKVQED